jgi:hypothetical protein
MQCIARTRGWPRRSDPLRLGGFGFGFGVFDQCVDASALDA